MESRNLPEFRESMRSIYCTRIESAIQTRLSSAKAIPTPFKRLSHQWGKWVGKSRSRGPAAQSGQFGFERLQPLFGLLASGRFGRGPLLGLLAGG